MPRRSRRSVELPLLQPFISASLLDPAGSLSPIAFSDMDMEKETLKIHNYGENPVSLSGFRLCDYNQYHWFQFPTFTLSPHTTVTIFCCPGTYMDRDAKQPYLKWVNKDGSLRCANVLNDEKETVYLYNNAGLCISSCFREHDSNALVTRHSHCSPSVRNFLSKCKLFLCYARILSLMYGIWIVSSSPGLFLIFFLVGHTCDILGRCIWLGDSDIDDKDMAIDPLVDAMNTSGDRLSTLVIMISIMLSIPDNMQMLIESGAVLSPPVAFTWLMHAVVSKNFFVGLLILDNLSHWMRKNAEVYYASSLSSVTEAPKAPMYHLSDTVMANSDAKSASTPQSSRMGSGSRKRRGSKGKGHATPTPRDDLGNGVQEPTFPDAVHMEPWPDTDELDLIDIMRVRNPLFLTFATVGNELMLIFVFSSIVALSDTQVHQALSILSTNVPGFRVFYFFLMISMLVKGALMFAQFLTSTSRVSLEVLAWKTRRDIIPRMH